MWPTTNNQILTAVAKLSTVVTSGFAQINNRLDTIMASQTDLDNAVAVVTGLLTDMATQTATVLTDLTDLQTTLAGGQTLDSTALNATVAKVAAIQGSFDAAVTSLSAVATA